MTAAAPPSLAILASAVAQNLALVRACTSARLMAVVEATGYGHGALHAAGRLTAPVVHSSSVPARTPIGYGGDVVTRETTRLCVVPLGYADGIPRELAREASVAILGRRCRVVGRVSMDQMTVDTGPEVVPLGARVTVFGPGDGCTPTVQDWAHWSGTIPQRIVAGIGPRVRRVIE